jgi:hypothetical protein
MDTETTPRTEPRTEEFTFKGDEIITKIRELVHEGNVRRIIIKNEQGSVVAEFPLTAGVIGVALLPMYAALGALLALAVNYTIVIERKDDTTPVQ